MVAQLVALRPGPTRWFHHDALGSTRALSNASGAVVGTFTYGPYGTLTASTGTATTTLGYAGQYPDAESGLIYLRAKVLRPGNGSGPVYERRCDECPVKADEHRRGRGLGDRPDRCPVAPRP